MSDDVAISVLQDPTESPAAAIVVPPVDDGARRAVRQYVASQLSPRSQQNAADALRRIARIALGPGADVDGFPWLAVNYDVAMRLRRAMYDLTLSESITPGTANLTLSHLRGLVRTMYAMKLISHEQVVVADPGMVKNIPGARRSRGRALLPAEERSLRAAARDLGGYRGAMLDTAIVLAVGAGFRREEVAEVELGGLEPGLITVVGKGNKERGAPIDGQMQRAIDDWLPERERLAPAHQRIFCSPQKPDWPLSRWSFWSLVREASHAAFGDRQPCEGDCACLRVVTGPHDFRRTFATRLLDQGLDIRQVQVLMGHESPETTARYDKRAVQTLHERRRGMRVVA